MSTKKDSPHGESFLTFTEGRTPLEPLSVSGQGQSGASRVNGVVSIDSVLDVLDLNSPASGSSASHGQDDVVAIHNNVGINSSAAVLHNNVATCQGGGLVHIVGEGQDDLVNMVFTSNKNPALWREDFNEDSTLLCALDRIFDEATVFKLRGESFRGKKLDTVSVQTGKVKAVELLTDQQEE